MNLQDRTIVIQQREKGTFIYQLYLRGNRQ